MCGRFTCLTYDELSDVLAAVEGRLGALAPLRTPGDGASGGSESGDDAQERRPQARPGSEVSALVADAGTARLATFRWGLNGREGNRLVFNARIESALAGSPMWREPIATGRCIVPAASFFEPHTTQTLPNPRGGRPRKQQYEFRDPEGLPLLLAALRSAGSVSIVTTQPCASVAPIHPRMPLALRFQEVETWLHGAFPVSGASGTPADLAGLADRSGIVLQARAEAPAESTPSPAQLALF